MSETWEMATLDWSLAGADGMIVRPADVGALILAGNEEQAKNAYYRVADAIP